MSKTTVFDIKLLSNQRHDSLHLQPPENCCQGHRQKEPLVSSSSALSDDEKNKTGHINVELKSRTTKPSKTPNGTPKQRKCRKELIVSWAGRVVNLRDDAKETTQGPPKASSLSFENDNSVEHHGNRVQKENDLGEHEIDLPVVPKPAVARQRRNCDTDGKRL